jgi:hypothetical protein
VRTTKCVKKSRKRGRPIQGQQKKQRYQIMLAPSVANEIRAFGGYNLSRGIALYVADNERLILTISGSEKALREIACRK